jgi:hypothetical protein
MTTYQPAAPLLPLPDQPCIARTCQLANRIAAASTIRRDVRLDQPPLLLVALPITPLQHAMDPAPPITLARCTTHMIPDH